jgi:predicted metal-dependent phosphoesterase TrpH
MFIDLHTHTTCSDGTLSPEALVQYAQKKNLKAVAVTDHDSVSGNERALKEGEKIGIEVIPGVELSAECSEGNLHILGLYVDSESDFLKKATQQLQKKRRERNLKILETLNEFGIYINKDDFIENAYLGRPNIASNLVQSGHVSSIDEAFEKFLKRGAPAYIRREKLSKMETLEAVVKAGGIPVLAHPVTVSNPEDIIEQLICEGLKGIEVYYPSHSYKDILYFKSLAQKYDLIMTGGSDFHGSHKPHIDLGCMHVPAHLLDSLKRQQKMK